MGLSRVPSFSDRPGFPSGLRVLVVEHKDDDREAVDAQLRQCNYDVTSCSTEEEALQSLSCCEQDFDLLMCEAARLPLVIMGENTSQDLKMASIRVGAVDILEKPLSLLKLRNIWQHTVRKILKQKSSSQLESLQNAGNGAPSSKAVERPPAAAGRPTPSVLKAAPADCARQESSGSSSADPSPLSTHTVAAGSAAAAAANGDGSGSGAAAGTGKGGKASRASAERQLRGMRSSSSSKSTMRTRSSASLDGLPPQAKGGKDARGNSPPLARVLSPAPEQTGGATQYNLQGMPPPLPGCVWGLPMLPPPVPGLGGNGTMMMPMAPPMSSPMNSQFYQSSNPAASTQWQQGSSSGGGCVPAARLIPAGSLTTCVGQPPAGGAGVSSQGGAARVFAAPHGRNGSTREPTVKGGSINTWSQEPDETAMGGMSWNDVDMLPFDDDADGDDVLHQFSAELLADEPDTDAATGDAGAQDVKGLVRGLPSDLNLAAADVAGDTLSWMDDTYLLEDGLGEKNALFDMIA